MRQLAASVEDRDDQNRAEEGGTEWHQLAPEKWPLRTLKRWSTKANWQAQAEAYDAALEAERNERAREIMACNLALVYENWWAG